MCRGKETLCAALLRYAEAKKSVAEKRGALQRQSGVWMEMQRQCDVWLGQAKAR